jgi:hypothetical protein
MPKLKRSGGDFQPDAITVGVSALRMAQRTLARLRRDHKVIWLQAPDGSTIYGLAEAGARQLVALGIPAKSGKDAVRRVSLSQFHHRRLANEVAILAMLQGYRVASEQEIAAGQWLGGMKGINGKKPDVLVRDGKSVWWVEVERSRRNAKDASKIFSFVLGLWPAGLHASIPAALPDGHLLVKVLFICDGAFIDRLTVDLRKAGWTEEHVAGRLTPTRLLYVSEARFLLKDQTKMPAQADATPK